MEWKFDAITPQTTKVDPAHLEFFRSEALEDMVSALVREDIQNRLDARLAGNADPVRVRYYLSDSSNHLPADHAKCWLKGLESHLNSPHSLEEIGSEPINFSRPMPYLTIEDFNTTGLRGDPLETSDPDDGTDRNDFYWFIRNVGRTGKKAGDRGRWGLGKIVYPASSSIRSFYAYSVRVPDERPALIGRSVLAIHAIGGTEYHSEGYGATFPNTDYPYLAVPIEEHATIAEFTRHFGLTRKPNEPGLSLVIPFPESSVTQPSLTKAILQHYFWEILRGNLEVTVATNANIISIGKDSINDVVMTWPGLSPEARVSTQRRLEFCRKADSMKLTEPGGYFELNKPSSYSCKIAELFKSKEELDRASVRYRNGQIVAAEFAVSVRKKDVPPKDASFLVYIQRDEILGEPDETFIRDGLTIIGESRIREAGVRALVLAEDPTLTEFLGDAENPAHTRWLSTTKHFRGKYTHGHALLDYIRQSALKLANLLGKVENQMLEDLLDDVFGIPDATAARAQSNEPISKRGDRKPGKGGFARRRHLVTSRLVEERGFKVALAPDAERRPDKVIIRVAYEPETGDPFKQYHPADFDFTEPAESMKIELKDCRQALTEPNRIEIEPLTNEFTIRVTGFDQNRDIRIDARPQFANAEAEVDA